MTYGIAIQLVCIAGAEKLAREQLEKALAEAIFTAP